MVSFITSKTFCIIHFQQILRLEKYLYARLVSESYTTVKGIAKTLVVLKDGPVNVMHKEK